MPVLEVRHPDGRVEMRPLSAEGQLLVGQIPSADILVDGAGVQAIHCRFMLKKNGCEVTAATAEGVQCNGQVVRKARLNDGDVVRVGDVAIVLRTSDAPRETDDRKDRKEKRKEAGEKDAPLPNVFRPAATAKAAPREAPPPVLSVPATPPVNELSLSQELQAIDEEAAGRAVVPDEDFREPESFEEEFPEAEFREREVRPPPAAPDTFGQQLKAAIGGPKRPGEQEIVRSPLVIILTAGALALLLAAGTMWLILSRDSVNKKFAAARDAYTSGRYTEAMEAFELFLKENPRDGRLPEARLLLHKAKVDQRLTGAVPDWSKGLEEFKKFLTDHRDAPEFQDSKSELRTYVLDTSIKVATGAATSAGQQGKRPLLAVSAEGQKLVERYSPPESAPKLLEELDQIREKAEQDVIRHETYEAAVAKIDQALKADKTQTALNEYKALLRRYDMYASTKAIRDRLKSILDREQKRSPRQEGDQTAATEDHPPRKPAPLVLTRRVRERSDRTSAGETVLALADDACFGLDSVTGEPRFHRVVGMTPAFFPLAVPTATPGWLLFDSRNGELLVLNRNDGRLQWRLKLKSAPAGAPLVHEGQIYVATASGDFLQVDLGTGKLQARVEFSQKVHGPPVLSPSGERLYVIGNENVLYVLTRRPLACERALYLGHGPSAITAPLVPLRHYLLLAENDRVQSCRLRLLKVVPEDQLPAEVDSERVPGQVREACLVRGRELFVPSSPERVSAFSVSETDNDQALALIAEQQVQSPISSRMFLAAGPDGQLWMASSGLRRFQLTKDSLLPEGPSIAAGLTSQPLQATGEALYVARRLPYSRAVILTEADRQRMLGEWQVTLGGALLDVSVPAGEGTPIGVTSAGDVFRIAADRLAAGGFEPQAAGTLALGDNPTHPLHASRLTDGSLAVWCGGKEPRLFQVGGDSPIRPMKLAEALQADPVQLADGWLLPLSGKLRLAFRPPAQPVVQDWLLEIGKKEPPAWRGVLRLDQGQAIASTVQGRVSRVQLTEGTPPHLAEVVHFDTGAALDLPPVLTPAGVVVADVQPRLVVLDANSLEPRDQQPLAGPALRLSADRDRLFVEFKDKLACYVALAGQPLKPAFDWPIEKSPPAGPPIVQGDRVILALQDGRILSLDAEGKPTQLFDLRQTLAFGPRVVGDLLLVGGVDGSVFRITLP